MTAAQIERMCRASPFRPFRMHLADGRSLLIRHPEMVILSAAGRLATVHEPDEEFEVVDVVLIISLRPVRDEPAA